MYIIEICKGLGVETMPRKAKNPVEVKTRKSDKFGRASEFVDFRKQEKLRRAALYFIKDDNADMRFDVVEVYHTGGAVTEITHIEDAF